MMNLYATLIALLIGGGEGPPESPFFVGQFGIPNYVCRDARTIMAVVDRATAGGSQEAGASAFWDAINSGECVFNQSRQVFTIISITHFPFLESDGWLVGQRHSAHPAAPVVYNVDIPAGEVGVDI